MRKKRLGMPSSKIDIETERRVFIDETWNAANMTHSHDTIIIIMLNHANPSSLTRPARPNRISVHIKAISSTLRAPSLWNIPRFSMMMRMSTATVLTTASMMAAVLFPRCGRHSLV